MNEATGVETGFKTNCTRCGAEIELRPITESSTWRGWFTDEKQYGAANGLECPAADGAFGKGRLHHSEGHLQLFEEGQ